MQIMSPFSNPAEVKHLIEAGASELYCGIVPVAWEKRFTLVGSVNLRHDRLANLSSFSELQKAVRIAGRKGVPVSVAFNAHFYSGMQLPVVAKQLGKAVKAGADTLIIADPSLMQIAVKKFPKANISVSTGQPCFNTAALSFFKELGASRVVLPRHLTVEEIRVLVNNANKQKLETECFVLNAICPFIDGLCTFQHVVESNAKLAVRPLACRADYSVRVSSKEPGEKQSVAKAHVNLWSNGIKNDCGLCALPWIVEAKATSVKIAGRANSLHKKLADLEAVKQAIALAGKLPKKRFVDEAGRIYFELFKQNCACKNCYYPGAGKWKK